MRTIQAAVVHSFDAPPVFETVASPTGDFVLDMLAVAVHPRTRSAAEGRHYTSTGELPLVPGIDGVGRDPDGRLRYFILEHSGSLAEQVAIDPRRSALLPGDVDPVLIAAAMNPAMSAWIALRKRIDFTPGMRVAVLGATGNAGRMAVQIAKHLGASSVVAAGRNSERLALLPALGADTVVTLDEVGEAAAEVDVVIDYLWGAATAQTLPAILQARSDRGRPLTWIEIGSMAGLELALPSAWLRAARLTIVGSGQGSVPTAEIVQELGALAVEVAGGGYTVDAVATPLRDIESAWNAPLAPGQRLVFVP